MNLTEVLHRARRERPAAIATVDARGRLSWEEFVARVARLAGALRALGVAPGDRVAMLAANSTRYLEYIYGCLWAGAVISPVNLRWTVPEIAYSLDDCGARVLLVDDAWRDQVENLRAHAAGLRSVIWAGDGAPPAGTLDYETLLRAWSAVDDARRQGSDLAAVLYTGGTTGKPKGVMLSHDNLALDADATLAAAPRGAAPVALHCAPLFHVGGLGFVFQLNARAARHVLMPAFEPGAALAWIAREQVSELFLVPTMIRRLLDHADFSRHDLSSLRTLVYGAAPIDASLLAQALRALPRVQFTQAYGQTEAGPVVSVLPHSGHVAGDSGRLASAGRAIGTAQIRIVDRQGETAPAGAVGEICVRGPTVMQGYWNRPAETAQALRDGWLHTGDGGYRDADGYLHVVDRYKDMIITGGENVYSAEVESVLLEHPQVMLCAVIGVPDEHWGERVHALVVLREGASVNAAELIAHCKARLAGYKCPRDVEFRSELPLSAAGKLLKYLLREPYWRHRERPL